MNKARARVHWTMPKYALFGPPTAHGEYTLATFIRLPSGNWRAQVRRKGRYIGETFRRRQDAEEWARDNESRIDRGEKPSTSGRIDPTTFGHLIDLHLADMKEVGKCPRRSKAFSLDALNKKLGRVTAVVQALTQGHREGLHFLRRDFHTREFPSTQRNTYSQGTTEARTESVSLSMHFMPLRSRAIYLLKSICRT